MNNLLFAFNVAQLSLFLLGAICFIVLFFIPAGYGKMQDNKWGFSFNNKLAWFLMEIPALITMITLMCLWATPQNFVRIIIGCFFILHYAQRVLIFPFLLKGRSKMPLLIVLMGMVFNTTNSFLIGAWLFYLSPHEMYKINWLYDIRFILGSIIFITGMAINIDSDKYIRSLRKPNDNSHYFPNKRMYRYVSSANYFGEILEWAGFAILSWSIVGSLFVFWTMANLVPRAYAINKKYKKDFPKEFNILKPKYIFPFIL